MTDQLISPAAAEEYSQALRQIGEGWWRQIAWASQQGIPQALGMSTREWAEEYHGYIRMPIPERQEAVRELAAEGLTQPQIANVLGVGQATVSRDLNPEPDIQMDSPEPEEPSDEREIESSPEPDIQMDSPEPEEPSDEPAEHVAATPQPNPLVTDHLDNSQAVQDIRYVKAFLSALTKADDFLAFDAERLASLLDPDEAAAVERYSSSVRRFTEQISRTRRGLHVINGGRA